MLGVLSGRAEAKERSTADLDGLYVTLGPVGSATRIENSWFAAAGAEISLVLLRERRVPALVGLAGGGVSYAGRDGGRLWWELETGFARPFLPARVGVGAGVAVEVDRVRPPRWGAQGTLWFYAGVIPYVRVGSVESSGAYVEAGVMIKIPVKIRY